MQRQAAELNQACLLPMQRQRELRQSLAHVRQEPHGLGLVLKANDDVVSVARDDDVSLGMALPPLVRPRIKDLVPLHSDFDRLTVPWFQCGQIGAINQDSDTPGHPRTP